MSINLTNVTGANNFYDIFLHMDNAAGGYISVFLLATVFIILFITLKKTEKDTKEVLLASSAIVSIVAVLMLSIGLIGWNIVLMPIIAFVAFFMIYNFSG